MSSPGPRTRVIACAVTFLAFFLIPALSSAQHTVNLTWDASTSPVVGYNVYRGFGSDGPYSRNTTALVIPLSYSDMTAKSGQTYYYVTTAVDAQGVESDYSNQTKAVIPHGGAGSESALYNFNGSSSDPRLPYAGLVFDKAGNLYGTTEFGGTNNHGTVFELTPSSSGSWSETVLYNFTGNSDGGQPYASLIFDSAGNLYGTTDFGGITNCNQGCGTVFKLSPGTSGWTESVLYSFSGSTDGRAPNARLAFDPSGNLYGTTSLGGTVNTACSSGCGTVFKLTPGSGGTWKESVLYAFAGASDGALPYGGLVFDPSGNLYGTASSAGAAAAGTIFKLTPGSGGSWTQSVIRTLTGGFSGKSPYSDLVADTSGNLYGTAFQGGTQQGYGVVFELIPESNGKWKQKSLHAFGDAPSASPVAGLVIDSAGNLFGTTMLGANQSACGGGCGTLFKLSRSSNGGWSYTVVHTFGRGLDGFHPTGDLILDGVGNLYGTTQGGGANGNGMVFQVMH